MKNNFKNLSRVSWQVLLELQYWKQNFRSLAMLSEIKNICMIQGKEFFIGKYLVCFFEGGRKMGECKVVWKGQGGAYKNLP